MAIQTINLTVPGGDTPRSANTKINANFTNTTHAASRLVGESANNVMQVGAFGLGNRGINKDGGTTNDYNMCGFFSHGNGSDQVPSYNKSGDVSITSSSTSSFFAQIHVSSSNFGRIAFRFNDSGYARTWREIYHTGNTTIDGNGLLKPSSPVLRVFSDRTEGNEDGDAMAATYTKNGVGDYTISGTTGLRSDGWYIVVPNDMNGNPKVAVTLDETDGVITLKTYVRIFDMTTFKFVPDLDQPLDIPDGRWIDLRFNDLPIDDVPLEV